MRSGLLWVCVVAGCGELQGAAPYTEAPSVDAAVFETTAKDARAPGLYDLDGYYVDDIIPATVGLFRLDRKSDPGHPWIVVVSSATPATPGTLGCETFATSGWNARLPADAMFHVLELGSTGQGTFTVKPASPPASDGAAVGRSYPSSFPLKLERAASGTVTIERTDASGARGSFDVVFSVLYEEDPLPYDQRVRGLFDAPACAVE